MSKSLQLALSVLLFWAFAQAQHNGEEGTGGEGPNEGWEDYNDTVVTFPPDPEVSREHWYDPATTAEPRTNEPTTTRERFQYTNRPTETQTDEPLPTFDAPPRTSLNHSTDTVPDEGCTETYPHRCDESVSCASDPSRCLVKCDEGKVRCWNSDCVDSLLQCSCSPKLPFRCPSTDKPRCVSNLTLCDKTCAIPTPFTCWNQDCAIDANHCPCPEERPHRCTVYSIKAYAQALAQVDMTANSIALTSATAIAGWVSVKVGSCVADFRHCQYNCPSPRFLCWDNRCVFSEKYCRCRPEVPVRCWDRSCVAHRLNCTCPYPNIYKMCSDGVCRRNCDVCPKTTPVRCSDGTCAITKYKCPCETRNETAPTVTIASYTKEVPQNHWVRLTAVGRWAPCDIVSNYALDYCWSISNENSGEELAKCCSNKRYNYLPQQTAAASPSQFLHRKMEAQETKCSCDLCVGSCCERTGECPSSSCVANGLGANDGTCGTEACEAICDPANPNCEKKCIGRIICTTEACSGFNEGQPCVYDGSSETFKVCTDYVWPCTPSEYRLEEDGMCLPLTTCTEFQFEATPPTETSNRVCSYLTNCTETEYESTAPTATSDRVCTALTECTSQQYELTPPTATSDRICMDLTVCTDDQYQVYNPSLTTDRVCANLTVCEENQYEVKPPTNVTDRVCAMLSECIEDVEYEYAPPEYNKDRICKTIKTCSSVEYETAPPTATSDRVCTRLTVCTSKEYECTPPTPTTDRVCCNTTFCFPDAFTNTYQQQYYIRIYGNKTIMWGSFMVTESYTTTNRECKPVSRPCVSPYYEFKPPTTYTDRICRLRNDTECWWPTEFLQTTERRVYNRTTGSYDVANFSQCVQIRRCTRGTIQIAPPTTTTDRVCRACKYCPYGQYASAPCTATTDTVCSPLTVCHAGQYMKVLPNRYRDRVCANYTVCEEGEVEYRSPTSYRDRACGPPIICRPGQWKRRASVPGGYICINWRICTSEQYEYQAPTVTSDRICRRLTRCRWYEFEDVPPTPTSNRLCVRQRSCGAAQYECGSPRPDASRKCCQLTSCISRCAQYPTLTSNRVCARQKPYVTVPPPTMPPRNTTIYCPCRSLQIPPNLLVAGENYTFTVAATAPNGLFDADSATISVTDPLVQVYFATPRQSRPNTASYIRMYLTVKDYPYIWRYIKWRCCFQNVTECDLCPAPFDDLSSFNERHLFIQRSVDTLFTAGTYHFIATYREEFSATAKLIIYEGASPAVSIYRVPKTVWCNRSLRLYASVRAAGRYALQWYVNNEVLPEAIYNYVVIPADLVECDKLLTVKVIASLGPLSGEAEVTVAPQRPIIGHCLIRPKDAAISIIRGGETTVLLSWAGNWNGLQVSLAKFRFGWWALTRGRYIRRYASSYFTSVPQSEFVAPLLMGNPLVKTIRFFVRVSYMGDTSTGYSECTTEIHASQVSAEMMLVSQMTSLNDGVRSRDITTVVRSCDQLASTATLGNRSVQLATTNAVVTALHASMTPTDVTLAMTSSVKSNAIAILSELNVSEADDETQDRAVSVIQTALTANPEDEEEDEEMDMEETGESVLTVLSSLRPTKNVAASVATLSQVVAKNAEPGTMIIISTRTQMVAGATFPVEDAEDGCNLAAGNASLDVPNSFFMGQQTQSATYVSLGAAVQDENPFGLDGLPNGSAVATSVYEFNIQADGKLLSVDNLTQPINISIPCSTSLKPGQNYSCKYYETSTQRWTSNGVTFIRYDAVAQRIHCSTSHLSVFAGVIDEDEQPVTGTTVSVAPTTQGDETSTTSSTSQQSSSTTSTSRATTSSTNDVTTSPTSAPTGAQSTTDSQTTGTTSSTQAGTTSTTQGDGTTSSTQAGTTSTAGTQGTSSTTATQTSSTGDSQSTSTSSASTTSKSSNGTHTAVPQEQAAAESTQLISVGVVAGGLLLIIVCGILVFRQSKDSGAQEGVVEPMATTELEMIEVHSEPLLAVPIVDSAPAVSTKKRNPLRLSKH